MTPLITPIPSGGTGPAPPIFGRQSTVKVDDYLTAAGDDDAAIDAAIAAASRHPMGHAIVEFADRIYYIAQLHAFTNGIRPLGQGKDATRIIATAPAAGIQIGPPLGGTPEYCPSIWGAFVYSGANISTKGITTNEVNAFAFDIGSYDVKQTASGPSSAAFACYGQNCNYFGVDLNGSYGSGLVFDQGCAKNRFWGLHVNRHGGWHIEFRQTVITPGLHVPQDNTIYDLLTEQAFTDHGNGLGGVLHRAGVRNTIHNAVIGVTVGAAIRMEFNTDGPGANEQQNGRMVLSGDTFLSSFLGAGSAAPVWGIDLNFVSGGVAGAPPLSDELIEVRDQLFFGTFDNGGPIRYGSTLSSRFPAHIDRYDAATMPYWTTNGAGALGQHGDDVVVRRGSVPNEVSMSAAQVAWGSARADKIYLVAPGFLATTSAFQAAGDIDAHAGAGSQVALYSNSGVPTIGFGAAADANIARLAAAALGLDSDLKLTTVGKGHYVKEGANATMGLATLVGGTVTVNTTKVTANSRIFLTIQAPGGTPGFQRVSARVAGTSFTILSSSGTDTSTVAWLIMEPA